MTRLRTWFATRSLRERRMLLVMAALAAVTLVWAGIIRPVGDALSAARERQAAAAVRLGETRAAIDSIKTVRALRAQPLAGALQDVVRNEADQAGFALETLEPQGTQRVRTTIRSARAGALTAWLARLERLGILVETATLRDNGDRTVGVDLLLKVQTL
ncbi:MAG TPA: type II secretion system protein GspM [Sphingomonas sp.]|jgi:general secretion pathway protein M|nr:type II secretion system protein GspM [Sphingomonas sp.]